MFSGGSYYYSELAKIEIKLLLPIEDRMKHCVFKNEFQKNIRNRSYKEGLEKHV